MSDWYEEMEKAEQECDAKEYELAQEYSRGYEQGKAEAFKSLEAQFLMQNITLIASLLKQ